MLTKLKLPFLINLQNNRPMSVAIATKSLQFSKFGEPTDALEICEKTIEAPMSNEVVVKILAAPINPADINTIQGKYPVKPEFPAIGGNECVAKVVMVGPEVKMLKKNDLVIPFATGLGTWTTTAKYAESDLMKISDKIGIVEAATLTVNPCTAYRMLKDFKKLKPGDTVIQNGANSSVGQVVHQLCKAWNIKSVGVVRDRTDVNNLKDYLTCLGATEILTEEEIRITDIFKKGEGIKKPRLGLNCIGGKNATEITRHLANKGILVTYGGMSREPVQASTASLIFKDISFRGFWMTRWTNANLRNAARIDMLNELCELIECGQLKAPIHEMVPFNNYRDALKASLDFKGFTGKKFILDMQNEN